MAEPEAGVLKGLSGYIAATALAVVILPQIVAHTVYRPKSPAKISGWRITNWRKSTG